jgi:chromosome segregation ATPase
MVEPIMIFVIGFLAASLCALVLMPIVHNRATRLTKKRLEAAAPLSMAELQADKDRLRAEFAVSTRRLEMLIDQLKAESAAQFADAGKKADAVNIIKAENLEKSDQITDLQTNVANLQAQLSAMSGELSAKAALLQENDRLLADKEAALAKLSGDLNERALAADSDRVEIITLRTQIDALKDRYNELHRDLDYARKVEAELREDLALEKQRAAATAANLEQTENAALRDRINEIAAEMAQLTVTLEGSRSPIHELLAANPQPGGAHTGNGGAADALARSRSLVERIRELQSKAQRASSP